MVSVFAAMACGKDSTPPLVPTTIIASPSAITLDAIGATQAVTVTVNDQNGHLLSTAAVTWTASIATVATVTGAASGTVVATGNGVGTVVAHAGTVLLTVPVTVAQVPVAPVKVTGDAQTGTVGAALTSAVRVKVQDRLGNAMPGVPVTFTPATANGSATPASGASLVDGTASALWTIGTVPGAQSLSVVVQGAPSTATFTATANVGPPASIAFTAGNGQTAITGSTLTTPPAAKVADSFNNPIAAATVTFTVTAGGGSVTGGTATTNATGVATVGSWVLGTTAGTNSLSVSIGNLTAPAITAAGVPGPATAVVTIAGAGQTAVLSSPVSTPPSIRVNDANGNGVSGVAVTFAVGTGGGSATGLSTTTNATGVAAVGSWTLGVTAGTNTLTATAAGTGLTGNPVTFSATAISTTGTGGGGGSTNLRIELRFLTTGTTTQVAAFTAAATRWQNIITAKLPDVNVIASAGQCGANSPAMSEVVDDIVIFVTFAAIDGVGGILGSAGPCFIRTTNALPVVGQMRFDTADLATMEANSTLNSVILHEMGHVLGIGVLWDFAPFFTLLQNPSLPSSPGVDTFYSGVNGIAGFNAIGGATYTGGQKVPVENTLFGAGTRDSHWRKSVLANELMTGTIASGVTTPLSLLTLRSLQDFGYTVNTALADVFFLTLTAAQIQEQSANAVPLGNDIIRVPIRMIDDLGRTVRVVTPPRE